MPRNSGSGNSHLAEPRWSVEFLDDRVEAEFDAFPAELLADFVHIAEMIQEVGLHAIGYPHVRHVREKLWEMRARVVLHGKGPTRDHSPVLHEKGEQNAAKGNRNRRGENEAAYVTRFKTYDSTPCS